MRNTLKYGYIFILYSIISLLFNTLAFLYNAQARSHSIWEIGSMYNFGEFISQDKKIIDYQVPANWDLLLNQSNPDWGEFPSRLYPPSDSETRTEELRINFFYLKDYSNPTLYIKATMKNPYSGLRHVLEVWKGEVPVILREETMKESINYIYKFPLGYIRKGDYQMNRIIITVSGPPEIPIEFDKVYLKVDETYETDSDGDGISDADEGDIYKDLEDTVSLPIKSYKPDSYGSKRIILHIEGSEGSHYRFREVGFLIRDSLHIPDWISENRFLPYEFLDFKVENVEQQEEVGILITFPEALYDSFRFYAYQDSNEWHETAYEIIDANTAMIHLAEGGSDDLDTETNSINSILATSYPYELEAGVEKKGCFIETLLTKK